MVVGTNKLAEVLLWRLVSPYTAYTTVTHTAVQLSPLCLLNPFLPHPAGVCSIYTLLVSIPLPPPPLCSPHHTLLLFIPPTNPSPLLFAVIVTDVHV